MSIVDFTVVVPLYNKVDHIGRAIRSVLKQTYQQFEIIVVDDGSKDGGADVVKVFDDPRITLLSQENAGVSVARNRGISISKGKLIAFLDADDAWKPEFLQTIQRLKESFPNAGAYATAYEIFGPNGLIRSQKYSGIPATQWAGMLPNYFTSAAFGDPPICASAVAVPREIFHELGAFPLGKRMGEDLDMWGRIALRYPIAFSSIVLSIYYKDADNRACLTFKEGDEHPFIETYEKFLSEGSIPLVDKGDVERYVARLKLENARQFVLAGNYKKAQGLVSEIAVSDFKLRQLLWGSRFNGCTRLIWRFCRRQTE